MPCDAITSVLCIFLLIVIAFREKSVQRPDRKPPFCAHSYQLLFVCTVLILEHWRGWSDAVNRFCSDSDSS